MTIDEWTWRVRGWAIAALVTVGVGIGMGAVMLSGARDTHLAEHLLQSGSPVVVTDVRVMPGCAGKGCWEVDTVEVRLPDMSDPVRLRGVVISDDPPLQQWSVPGPDSPYAAPLHVLVDPDDPQTAMAVTDAQESVDSSPVIGYVLWLAFGVAPALLCVTMTIRIARRRPVPTP